MGYTDTRTTTVEAWIREVVGSSPAIDGNSVYESVEAMLPHDARGRLVAERIQRRHVDEALQRLSKGQPDLFRQPPREEFVIEKDWNDMEDWERHYMAARGRRLAGLS